ncbi:MAG: hypothetical protein R3F37_01455 [Candidatus Competibacteraceae bacterium]
MNRTAMIPVASDTLGFARSDDYSRAREVLLSADYTPEGMGRTLGSAGVLTAQSADAPLWLRRTTGDEPLHTLIRLFLLNVPVEADKARHTLAPMQLDTWQEAGLLAVENDQVVPGYSCNRIMGSYWPRHAKSDSHRHPSGPCHGVAKSSLVLLNNTLRKPVRRCRTWVRVAVFKRYCAVRIASRFSLRIRIRAELFTHFNAALNGITNLQALTGNLFEPVTGRQFDLIVCNAPYVILPMRVLCSATAECAAMNSAGKLCNKCRS